MQDESYAAAVEAAKKAKSSIDWAVRLNPFAWFIIAMLVAILGVAIWAAREHASAQQDRADAQAYLNRVNANIERLKNSEKALARLGFWYDSDARTQFILFTKPGIKVYADTCNGYPCARFYPDLSH